MPILKRCTVVCMALAAAFCSSGQLVERILVDNIRTPMLFPYNNQTALPVIRLNSAEQLELHFDDLDADYKNYYYNFQLCNADWTPALLNQFDYTRGFTNNRINTFRLSSIALKRYTHYSVILPERTAVPTRSGNYILRVYLDGDTSKTVFTKRFLVVDEKATTGAQTVQPFNSAVYRTHQRMIIKLNLQSLNIANPQQQLRVVVLQNNRWDNAIRNVLPTFIRGKEIEFNTDNELMFEAGREWRWLDLRSFRYWSDRVLRTENNGTETDIYVKPDAPRTGMRYVFYRDLNGLYTIENTDRNNPYWQSNFARVHFTYVPPGNQPLSGKDVYITGALTNYALNDSTRMWYNDEKGVYETSVMLKQGFYSYQYATINHGDPARRLSIAETEGNFWETENTYQVLVYYRNFGARADELIGYTSINSFNGRLGN